ncbi:MAG: ComEC family competence protein [Candidatus Omnitrophica bacterium]|nr:ComEC family competence protein [Candidatus Omnitrophota bacterium]
MKRPLVFLALFFSLGIFVSSLIRVHLPFYPATIIFFIFSLFFIKKGLIFDILICCTVFFLGVSALKNYELLPRSHILNFIPYCRNDLYTVKGFVNSPPISRFDKVSFVFNVDEVQFNGAKYKCCGEIMVYTEGKQDLSYSEGLILTGSLNQSFRYGGSKRNNYNRYLYNQGIRLIMRAKFIERSLCLNKSCMSAVRRFSLWLKEKIEKLIFRRASNLTATILDAMMLGEKKNIPVLIIDAMVKTGTIHILVVSGFNVGIVAFVFLLFLKLIRIPRWMRFYLASLLLIIYCLMTGASNPVIRATLMAIVFMFAYLVKREADIYNSLALGMVFILWFNPNQLFDIGFQLSFVSVFSIAYLYPKLKLALRIEALKRRWLRFLCDGFLVSLSAWLGTMGFIAYYFNIFSPVTVLANIFIVPLASLITLCGFSLIAMELSFSCLSPFFAATCELLVSLLLKINILFVKIPGAYLYLSKALNS